MASFDRLLLARGYDGVSVRELTVDANVGRSTFYEHFGGKDELLEYSVSRLLAALAAGATTNSPSDALRDVLSHMGAQHALASHLLQGSARVILIRVLADKLEPYFAAVAERSATPPIAPLSFLAMSLAHAQLGVVEAWLGGDGFCDASIVARVLHTTTRAAVAAMFSSSG